MIFGLKVTDGFMPCRCCNGRNCTLSFARVVEGCCYGVSAFAGGVTLVKVECFACVRTSFFLKMASCKRLNEYGL